MSINNPGQIPVDPDTGLPQEPSLGEPSDADAPTGVDLADEDLRDDDAGDVIADPDPALDEDDPRL